jgi:hypothetical protein
MPRGTSTDADHLRKWLEEGVLLKADRVEGSVDLDDEDLVHVAIVVNVTSIGPHVGAMYVDQNRYHASADTSLQEAFEILQQWELDNNQDYFAELEQEYGDEAFDVFTETFDGLTWKLSPREFADAVAGTRADGLVDIRGGEGEGGAEEARRRGPRTVRQYDKGFYVMKWGGGTYTSVGWFSTRREAENEVERIKRSGAWRGMPVKIEAAGSEPPGTHSERARRRR